MEQNNKLTSKEEEDLLIILKTRFEKNMHRHPGLDWAPIELKLLAQPQKMNSLNEMEKTGGEPDVLKFDKSTGEYIFYDCSTESPIGRRSLCYDREALDSRKEFKPLNSAVNMAAEMGVELLSEEEYRFLQSCQKAGKNLDTKTSSWLKTPDDIRKLGGSIFADFRYGQIFVYHNGAQSYYAGRGFRALLRV